jgi:PAS domain S-box-containing protein
MRFKKLALATGLALLAAALQWLIQPWSGGRVPFLFFLPAIILAAAYGGVRPALIVVVVGGINGALIMRHGGTLLMQTKPEVWAALAYAVVASGLVFLGKRLNQETRRASSAETRLRTAETEASVGLFEVDVEQDTLVASSGFWQMIGRPSHDGPVPLSAWLGVLHPDDVEAARALLRQPAAQLSDEFEHRILLPDGEERWVMTRIRAEGDAGRTVRVRGVMIDITQRVLAAQALASAQLELQHQVADLNELHELSTRVEMVADLPTQLHEILWALSRMHGSTMGTVVLKHPETGALGVVASVGLDKAVMAKHARELTQPTPCERACAEQRRVVIEDTETDERCVEFRTLARAAGFRAVHSTPLFDHKGQLLGTMAVQLPQPRAATQREMQLADICARKAAVFVERARAEALAHERDRRFRSVLDASAAGFVILRAARDAEGIIRDFRWVYANPVAARHWNRLPEDVEGRLVRETLPGALDDGSIFDAYVAVARDGVTRELEHLSRQTAEPTWFHIIASPLEGDVAIWFTNVTARRRDEMALREADRRKDEFLATLAHELRNPLAPIRQATQVAMTPQASETQKRWSYAVIERQVQHMSLLLDDLLDISRITRGQLRLRRQACELRAIFSAAVEAARPLLDSKGHQLNLDLPEQPVALDADPLRLSQILSNLLTNAAKYTNPGGRIRASAREQDGRLVIEVEDNGIGLAPAELATIFQMFSQVSAAQERSEGGLGIGLALTRGLVELHGGSIAGYSDGPGRGARFVVHLPILEGATPPAPQATPAPALADAAGTAGGLRRRLVIADDNRDAAESLAILMRMEGHDVQLAHDGTAALDALRSFRADAALLDIGMPGLTGYEVARSARGDPDLRHVLLVAITGWGQASDKARALAEGFDVHMTKPVDVTRLVAVLQEHA